MNHDFHAAADGQLGGIMKVYRDWRISGDTGLAQRLLPEVQKSMDYCIRHLGSATERLVEEPHHNTYDIEFWGPDGMCTSFYLGALKAIIEMGALCGKTHPLYGHSIHEGTAVHGDRRSSTGNISSRTSNTRDSTRPTRPWQNLTAASTRPKPSPCRKRKARNINMASGCLCDGVLGAWLGRMCGVAGCPRHRKRSAATSLAVHRYNLRKDLTEHANPQRPTYAFGHEGGLLLCTWPKGGKLSLPFVYTDEVWTGIEYQVASHLMLMGRVNEGLDIVRLCRDRYDGRMRNPFNEYECGHWYARAMSSYALLQGLTGARYDAVDKTLYIDSKIGDFTCFLSTATGFGTVRLQQGKATVRVALGSIPVDRTVINKPA